MRPELQIRVQRYGWDKASGYYDDSWREQLKPSQDKLLGMVDLKPGEKVLETACGSGLVTLRAAEAVAPEGHVVATDLSEEMIRVCSGNASKRKIENVTYHRMDAENLELDEHDFDAAICALGLMYVPDPVKALGEMYRVLKPGGRMGVVVWGERGKCGWADIFPIVDRRVNTDVCPLFFQQGTGNTLHSTCTAAGFKEISLDRFMVPLHFKTDEDALVAAFSGGPVSLAYSKFDDKTRQAVHTEYLESIAEYRDEKGYHIPGEFLIATGFKLS